MPESTTGRQHAILDAGGNVVWCCQAASSLGDAHEFCDQAELLASLAVGSNGRAVAAGLPFVYRQFTVTPLRQPVAIVEWRIAPAAGVFTERQSQVLDAILNDIKPQHATKCLGMAMSTYESHRKDVLLRSGARGSATLARWAVANGLID